MANENLTQVQIKAMLEDIAMTAKSMEELCRSLIDEVTDGDHASRLKAVEMLAQRVGFVADKGGANCYGGWRDWFMPPSFDDLVQTNATTTNTAAHTL